MLFLALKKVWIVKTNKLEDHLENHDITKPCFRTKHAEWVEWQKKLDNNLSNYIQKQYL